MLPRAWELREHAFYVLVHTEAYGIYTKRLVAALVAAAELADKIILWDAADTKGSKQLFEAEGMQLGHEVVSALAEEYSDVRV